MVPLYRLRNTLCLSKGGCHREVVIPYSYVQTKQIDDWRGTYSCEHVYRVAEKSHFLQQVLRETQLLTVYARAIDHSQKLPK